jgi:muramoyltetrapeptide carboxypeptidase LdcA involved in peptidoglycan recycling
MQKLQKLQTGDKVAILSPSFAAPGKWPQVYELGLKRLKEEFGLIPVEYPSTAKIGATADERARDLIAAFEDTSIKAVITTIGGDDQITYAHRLPPEPFINNPKPFFGYSDNSHFCNFLFLQNIPSYYGGSLFTQYAMQYEMDEFTKQYLRHALFEAGTFELTPSDTFNDQGLSWDDHASLNTKRVHFENPGWVWSQVTQHAEGILWGGCVESVDEMLRHNTPIPSLEQFKNIVLMLETSEELPTADYVFRVLRALGERGILERIKGVLVGRAKAWEFNNQKSLAEKEWYREAQQNTFKRALAQYNPHIPLVQNLNFGHTDPQIPMPFGGHVIIDGEKRKIFASF